MHMKHGHPFGNILGTANLGPRGQVVIPKEARDKLKTKEGDTFLVIEHFGKIVLIPEKAMRNLIKQITKHLK